MAYSKDGRTGSSIPKIPSLAPNHRKSSRTTRKRNHQIPWFQTVRTQSGRLHAVRTRVGAEAGRGRATVPPPKPHPSCTRRERRTRAKGSGFLAAGPSMPLAWGVRTSWGLARGVRTSQGPDGAETALFLRTGPLFSQGGCAWHGVRQIRREGPVQTGTVLCMQVKWTIHCTCGADFGKRRRGPDFAVRDQPGSLFGCACCCLRNPLERNHHLTHPRATARGLPM